jgi:hypothetical protein
MSRTTPHERDRIREILDAIESGEIVIKNAADEVIQEIQSRLDDSSGPAEQSASG